jgi:hypothetical protein
MTIREATTFQATDLARKHREVIDAARSATSCEPGDCPDLDSRTVWATMVDPANARDTE